MEKKSFKLLIFFLSVCFSLLGAPFEEFYTNILQPRYGEVAERVLTHEDFQFYLNKPKLYARDKIEILKKSEKIFTIELMERFREEALKILSFFNQPELAVEILELDEEISYVSQQESKRNLYFALWKALAYSCEISSFNNLKYLRTELDLLRLQIKVLKVAEQIPYEKFPTYPSRPTTHFVFETFQHELPVTWGQNEFYPPFPFAVFKDNDEWCREEGAWEMASLFHIEEAFMPTSAIEIFGKRASLQPYWHFLVLFWPTDQWLVQNSYTVAKFNMKSYVTCCLGALLLSLYDQSYANCRYKQLDNGSLSIINFDNGAFLPCYNSFNTEFLNGEPHLITRSFWAWYFDFPQVNFSLKGSIAAHAKKLVAHFNEALSDFKQYLRHPLTNFFQDGEAVWLKSLEERIALIEKALEDPYQDITLKKILFRILPLYDPLLASIEKHISLSKGAAMTLLGCVNTSLKDYPVWFHEQGVPQEESDAFLSWYADFGRKISKNQLDCPSIYD